MHHEAHAGFGWALTQAGVDRHQPLRVLDLGGQDINGTVHDWFTHPDTTIVTLDLEGADITADARTWVPDQVFDLVIATELFEHLQGWEHAVRTAAEALNPLWGVFVTTCASTHRQPHGATGAPAPAAGEWYQNVEAADLVEVLRRYFPVAEVTYQYPPGDAYAWAGLRPTLDVTVVIPTIPGREALLERAVASVAAQTLQPYATLVELDVNREGPAGVRNRALDKVETEWVAFLDDDDEFLPHHLLTLARTQRSTGADLVWPWFQVVGGRDPFPQHRGRQWDPDDPHQIPVTVLARHSALLGVGGFHTMPVGATDRLGHRCGEDWQMWLALSAAGCLFAHVDEVTWVWHHHGGPLGNTSGLPSRVRWDSRH